MILATPGLKDRPRADAHASCTSHLTQIVVIKRISVNNNVTNNNKIWYIVGILKHAPGCVDRFQRVAGLEEASQMDGGPMTDVGGLIRKIRVRRGLSQRALAQKSGLSANAISRIERGESSPTVTSLHRMAAALEVPIVDFFEMSADRSQVIVKKNDRPRTRGDGVLIESLGIGLPRQMLEPFLMSLRPGMYSGEDPISHPGEEFVHCLAGRVEYLVADDWYSLEAGDSLLFQSDQQHLCMNSGDSEAVVLLVILSTENPVRHSPHEHLLIGRGEEV